MTLVEINNFEQMRLEQLFIQQHVIYAERCGSVHFEFMTEGKILSAIAVKTELTPPLEKHDDAYLINALIEDFVELRLRENVGPLSAALLILDKGEFCLSWY